MYRVSQSGVRCVQVYRVSHCGSGVYRCTGLVSVVRCVQVYRVSHSVVRCVQVYRVGDSVVR